MKNKKIFVGIILTMMLATSFATLSSAIQPINIRTSVNRQTLFEYYDGGEIFYSAPIVDIHEAAQTFTIGTVGANVNFFITGVKLALSKYIIEGSVGNVYVSIRENDPYGSEVTNGYIDGDTLPDIYPAWCYIPVQPHLLLKDHTYAIVLSAPECTGVVYWTGITNGEYGGGSHFYTHNAGETWTNNLNGDLHFEVWGNRFTSSVIP